MNTSNIILNRDFTSVTVDRHGILLAALFVAVISASVAIVPTVQSSGSVDPVLAGQSTTTAAAGGAAWAVAEAALALSLLGLIAVWRRLPEWLREALSDGIGWMAFMFVGASVYTIWGPEAFWNVAMGSVIFRVGIKALHHYDLFWLFMNAFAITVAIAIGAYGGVALPLPFLVVGLLGLSIYDHYFANERPWMFQLGASMVRKRLPVLIVVPSSWKLDWDELADAMESDADEDAKGALSWGIGMADIALPAMVAAGLVARSSPVAFAGLPLEVWGVVAGVVLACFRLRYVMEHRGGGAGLPALATGTLGGWAIAAGAVWVLLL